MDEYLQRASACMGVDELAVHVVTADPCVARWYACMVRGLRARRAGRSRVRSWRPSPGCGVNRRCRNFADVSERAPLHAKEAMDLFAQEADQDCAVNGPSRWGRLGELWMRAACWVLVVGDAGKQAMDLFAQEADQDSAVHGPSRWGRLGELWMRAACWALVVGDAGKPGATEGSEHCLLYTSPSPRDQRGSRMPSSA